MEDRRPMPALFLARPLHREDGWGWQADSGTPLGVLTCSSTAQENASRETSGGSPKDHVGSP